MKLTKEEKSWIMYDCGNSAYSMAITTALFILGLIVFLMLPKHEPQYSN